jgi:protein-disulfide isomerase
MRAAVVFVAQILLVSALTACGAPGGTGSGAETPAGGPDVAVPGLDLDALTAREQGDVAAFLSETVAPCPELKVSLRQCVNEHRACPACVPAVRFLVTQVRRGKTPVQVEAAYRTRFAPDGVKPIDVTGSPSRGATPAAVLIVEWADFECPGCQGAAPLLDAKVAAYPKYVGLVFKHYPLDQHQFAVPAAYAAVAADRQGRFWEFHDRLFKSPESLADPGLIQLAREIGLDLQRFEDDRHATAAQATVQRDRQQADALGLHSTPMIYINGRYFDGELFNVVEDLDDWIQDEVEMRTGQRPRPRSGGQP